MTLASLKTDLATIQKKLASGDYMRDALAGRTDELMSFQYQQLFNGKQSNGEDIRPYYSEDLKPIGYFRSKETAERYSAWKETGIPYPFKANRNPDAPNLYIDGTFHSELGVVLGEDMMVIKGTTNYADGIVAKYGLQTFGLDAQSWGEMLNERGVADDVLTKIIEDIK